MNVTPASMITKAASKQTHHTIQFLSDRERADDAFRAHGYFRWVDGIPDADSATEPERRAFVERQKFLLAECLCGEMPQVADVLAYPFVPGQRARGSHLASTAFHGPG